MSEERKRTIALGQWRTRLVHATMLAREVMHRRQHVMESPWTVANCEVMVGQLSQLRKYGDYWESERERAERAVLLLRDSP